MNPLETLRTAFEREFGTAPRWIVRAPGRINLIGEHVDHYEGVVLPMAIDREILLAAAPNRNGHANLRSTEENDAIVVDLDFRMSPRSNRHWSEYLRGVLAGFLDRGLRPAGFDLLVHSTLPRGQGLSGGAALTVATATLLEAITGRQLNPLEKALLCQGAEHMYAGVSCGIMNPFICTFARRDHALFLDCRSYQFQHVPFDDPTVSLLIISTHVRHASARSEYPLRRSQCEQAARQLGVSSLREVTPDDLRLSQQKLDPVTLKRVRHVVMEIIRTFEATDALKSRQWARLGELLYRSHRSLRADFEVSCPELDTLVEIAEALGESRGVYGCRMSGCGFGGCAIALVKTEAADSIADHMRRRYCERFLVEPSIFRSRPEPGASVLA